MMRTESDTRLMRSKFKSSFLSILAILLILTLVDSAVAQPGWIQLSPTGTAPPPRHWTAGVYDPSSNRMIIFGGSAVDGSGNMNDVWVLTYADGLGGTPAWINLIPNGATGSPPIRNHHTMVYDAANNRMILWRL